MSNYCVIVADSARARFFTLEAPRVPGLESGPNLIEHESLINPEGMASGRETWANAKSGRNSAPFGGSAHGYDDHRDNHEEEFGRRFAKRVIDSGLDFARRNSAKRVVVVAAKRTLGHLREVLPSSMNGCEVREMAKDLGRRSPREIHVCLSTAGLLPQRRRASAAP